ncbi:putative transposase [Firmicutes bacterium CAG:536]|nr:putative transposase [Firmicutes bacterium CAG:536]
MGNKKGETRSNNFLKQQKRVNKIHRHIANQRNDFLHKRSTEIANRYDVVAVEDLNMRSLSNKGFGNGKATMDNGYGTFLNMLEYKMNRKGKYFVKVDRFYPSSQTCHVCGCVDPKVKNLSIRKWVCSACGAVHDRDVNAAINIRDEGLRLLGLI